MDTTCHLINKSPSSVLDDKIPHEVWTGEKPSLACFGVFSYDSYVLVPKEIRTQCIVNIKGEPLLAITMVWKVISFEPRN